MVSESGLGFARSFAHTSSLGLRRWLGPYLPERLPAMRVPLLFFLLISLVFLFSGCSAVY